MRNSLIIFLLILFSASQLGNLFVLNYQQNNIKKQVKEQIKKLLPESSLHVIAVDDNVALIEWEEYGREFKLHGVLYDVARIKTVNGKTFLYCIEDKKEGEIYQEYAKAIKSAADNNGSSKSGKANFKFQPSDFYFFNVTQKISTINFIASNSYSFFVSSLASSVKEVNGPPPRA